MPDKSTSATTQPVSDGNSTAGVRWALEDWHLEDLGDGPEIEMMVCHLLMNREIMLNTPHWHKEWPEEVREQTWVIAVVCNDLFFWGCADAQRVTWDEIGDVYKAWREDPRWGTALWCLKKRGLMPQPPIEDQMLKAGIDLAALGLKPNPARSPAVSPDHLEDCPVADESRKEST